MMYLETWRCISWLKCIKMAKEVCQVFHKQANKEHPIAILFTGLMYEKGHGVDVDLQKRKNIKKKAAEKRSQQAKTHLEQLQ